MRKRSHFLVLVKQDHRIVKQTLLVLILRKTLGVETLVLSNKKQFMKYLSATVIP